MNNQCQFDGTFFNQDGVCEKCGNTRQIQESANQGMMYQNPAYQNPAYQNQPYQNPGYQNQGYQNPNMMPMYAPYPQSAPVKAPKPQRTGDGPAKNMLRNAWEYVKCLFANKPMQAVQNACKDNSLAWVVLGTALPLIIAIALLLDGIYKIGGAFSNTNFATLCVGAGTMIIAPDQYMDGNGAFMKKYYKLLELANEKEGLLFLFMLGILLTLPFALTWIRKLFFIMSKKKVGFMTTLNITTVTMIPIAVAAAAGIIFAFFAPVISLLLMVVGVIAGYIQLYFGVQKIGETKTSPFWMFALVIILDFAALYLICSMFFWIFC